MARYCKKGRSKGCPYREEHYWDVRCPRDHAALRWYRNHITQMDYFVAQNMRDQMDEIPNPETRAVIVELLAFYTLQEESDATISYPVRD